MEEKKKEEVDLERWFHELTHKYKELIGTAHVQCHGHFPPVQALVGKYYELYTRGRSYQQLSEFSLLLRQVSVLLKMTG